MSARPIPEPIAPGQESVWDYPRPPAVRASDEEITVILGGVEICAARTSWRILETGHPPTYYLPRSAFIESALRPARGWSFCEWKGRASYLDVIGGTKIAPRAAWYYPHPDGRYSVIADHVSLYAGAMDECIVDGERVVPQAGHFYGGWITSTVIGPFKRGPGTGNW
jgi:uncharacterized protein (DUF427 family)